MPAIVVVDVISRTLSKAAAALAVVLAALPCYRRCTATVSCCWCWRGGARVDLLPPTPATYIAARIVQLARGTCVKAFNWNGGGEHAGHPWTPDLPTDSAVALLPVCCVP